MVVDDAAFAIVAVAAIDADNGIVTLLLLQMMMMLLMMLFVSSFLKPELI